MTLLTKGNPKGRKLRFCLNQKEVDLLRDKPVNLRDKGIIIMGLYCGFRVSETVNFQWGWVNYSNKSIKIQENLKPIKWKPKYESERDVFPSENPKNVVFEFLEIYNENYVTKNYVFNSLQKVNHYRLTTRYVIGLINEYAKSIPFLEETPHLGKAIGSHALRRTYASTNFNKLIEKGFNFNEAISICQKLLGHRNPKVTADYLFLANEADLVRSVKDIELYS